MKHDRTSCRVVLLAMALAAGTATAGTFTDAADGDYSNTATWDQAGSPAGGGADTVTIDAHVVTVSGNGEMTGDTVYLSGAGTLSSPDYAGIPRFNGSVLHLRQGGALRFGRTTVDQVGDCAVIADDGQAVLEMANTQNGDENARNMCGSLQYGGGASGLVLRKVVGGPGSASPGIGFMDAVFDTNCAIALPSDQVHLQTYRVQLAAGHTLDVSGAADWLLRGTNDADFAGTVTWTSSGDVRVMAADAFGTATVHAMAGNVSIESANSIRGAVLNVYTGVQVRTPDYETAGRYTGGTLRMRGGQVYVGRTTAPTDMGGTLILAAPGNSFLLQNQNGAVETWPRLIVESDGASLALESVYTSEEITSAFSACEIRADGAFHLNSAYCPLRLENLRFTAGRSIAIDGVSQTTLAGATGLRLRGDAALLNSERMVLVTNAGVTITDNSTWEDATMWTKSGSVSTALTAKLTAGARRGLITGGAGAETFAASDLGYVTVEGMTAGQIHYIIITFDGSPDLAAIRSKLAAAHPEWTNFYDNGSNRIAFQVIPDAAPTHYVGWDNKHGSLGANVTGIQVAASPFGEGTVLTVW